MKYVFCALALVAVVLSATPALSQVFSWDGGGSDSLWSNDSNWRNNVEPPMTGTHDVSIKAGSLVSPFQSTANWSYASTGSCATLELVANTSLGTVFRKSGSGGFTTSGRLSLTGFSSTRTATLDADSALSVTGLTARSFATLDIASGVTVDCNGSMLVDANSGYAECTKIGAGSLTPDSLWIEVGDSAASPAEHALMLITAGAINLQNAFSRTSVVASSTVDLEATLRVEGGILDPISLQLFGGGSTSREAIFEFLSGAVSNPAGIDMYGFSRIDADQSFTVAGSFTTSVSAGSSFATQAQIDVASFKTVDVNGTLTVNGVNGQAQLQKIGTGAFTLDHIAVLGGNAANEHSLLILSDGNVTASAATNPTTTIEAANTVDADATLRFEGTSDTFTPRHLRLLGGGNAAGGGLAFFDMNVGTLVEPDSITMAGLSRIEVTQEIGASGALVNIAVNSGDTFATEATIIGPSPGVLHDIGELRIGGSQSCTLVLVGGLTTDGTIDP